MMLATSQLALVALLDHVALIAASDMYRVWSSVFEGTYVVYVVFSFCNNDIHNSRHQAYVVLNGVLLMF